MGASLERLRGRCSQQIVEGNLRALPHFIAGSLTKTSEVEPLDWGRVYTQMEEHEKKRTVLIDMYNAALEGFRLRPEVQTRITELFLLGEEMRRISTTQEELYVEFQGRCRGLRQEARQAHAIAQKVRSVPAGSPDSFSARAYGLISSLPIPGRDRVGERLFPLEHSHRKYLAMREKVRAVEFARDERFARLQEEREHFESQVQEKTLELRSATEEWVLGSQRTVLGYAVSNPSRKDHIFRLYSQNTDDPTATRQALDKEYAELVGARTNNNTHVIAIKPCGKNRRLVTEVARSEHEESETQEEKEKEPYPVGVVRKKETEKGKMCYCLQLLNKEELDDLIAKQAGRLAPGDTRFLTDVQMVVAELRKDPFGGREIKRLTQKSICIGNRTLPLRTFNPRKRPGLSFAHRLTDSLGGMALRVVFALYEQDTRKTILLEGIYTHKEYDREFKSGK